MTADEGTLRLLGGGRPVKGIRIEVVDGEDRGGSAETVDGTLTLGSADGNDLVISDPSVSRIHASIERRGDRIAITDHDSTNGTEVGPARIRGGTLTVSAGARVRLGKTTVEVTDGAVTMREEGPEALGPMRGRTEPMRHLMATIARVAPAEVPVLVTGESGTGKELVARAIHDASSRADQPFVTVDCAALTPSLFTSELFGHERGAFTGAERRHIGACERASDGTLFLDEIGEIPFDVQGTLLGVLERGRIRRVGGRDEVPVDLRVVAATHRDLHADVNAGTFRLDLFYRIAVVRLETPPLRERRRDIPLLVEHFLREAGHGGTVSSVFDDAAMAHLQAHSWPGNVRELRNVVLGTLALGTPAPLMRATGGGPVDDSAGVIDLPFRDAKRRIVEAFESRYLQANLDAAGGSVREMARRCSMDRSHLMELLKRHGIRSQKR